MSRGDPTLAEFLVGYKILVPQKSDGRLVAYRYSHRFQRFLFRELGGDVVNSSKKKYTVAEATDVYHQITPKKRAVACR